jgi:hypothetical protein
MNTDPAAIADLPVTLVDVTAVRDNDAFGHSIVQTSPLMSALFRGLADFGPETVLDLVEKRSLVEASVDIAREAATIVLHQRGSR